MYSREELEAARVVLVQCKEQALAAAQAELSKVAVINMLLAGSLAHEFLGHGMVLGGRVDRSSAELSCLLLANGAHVPGIVNPTQILAIGAHFPNVVDPTQLLDNGAHLPGVVDPTQLGRVSTEDEPHAQQTKGDADLIAAEPEDSFLNQATTGERYEIYKALFDCKMAEGSSVSQHVLRLSGYMQRLEALDCPVSQELGTDLILASLPPPMDLLQKQAPSEIYEIYKTLLACKMAEGTSVSQHVLRLSGYMQRLEALNCPIPQELGTELILASLPPSYSSFIMSYKMNKVDRGIGELFAMLKTAAESGVRKEVNHATMVNKTTSFKKMKAKSKKKGKSKGASGVGTPMKSGPHPDAECFFCKETGHWKRNCNKYLAEKKMSANSVSGTI